jgi:hypothetical protein
VANCANAQSQRGDVLKGTNTSARMNTGAQAKVTKESDLEQLKE